MDTTFMNSGKSKTPDPHRLLLNSIIRLLLLNYLKGIIFAKKMLIFCKKC